MDHLQDTIYCGELSCEGFKKPYKYPTIEVRTLPDKEAELKEEFINSLCWTKIGSLLHKKEVKKVAEYLLDQYEIKKKK
jgi:hypothetical protein